MTAHFLVYHHKTSRREYSCANERSHACMECSQDCPNPTPNRSSSVNGLHLNNVRASSALYSACTIGPL